MIQMYIFAINIKQKKNNVSCTTRTCKAMLYVLPINFTKPNILYSNFYNSSKNFHHLPQSIESPTLSLSYIFKIKSKIRNKPCSTNQTLERNHVHCFHHLYPHYKNASVKKVEKVITHPLLNSADVF